MTAVFVILLIAFAILVIFGMLLEEPIAIFFGLIGLVFVLITGTAYHVNLRNDHNKEKCAKIPTAIMTTSNQCVLPDGTVILS